MSVVGGKIRKTSNQINVMHMYNISLLFQYFKELLRVLWLNQSFLGFFKQRISWSNFQFLANKWTICNNFSFASSCRNIQNHLIVRFTLTESGEENPFNGRRIKNVSNKLNKFISALLYSTTTPPTTAAAHNLHTNLRAQCVQLCHLCLRYSSVLPMNWCLNGGKHDKDDMVRMIKQLFIWPLRGCCSSRILSTWEKSSSIVCTLLDFPTTHSSEFNAFLLLFVVSLPN